MTTFTTDDRKEAEKEPIPFAGWVQHSDDTVTPVIPKRPLSERLAEMSFMQLWDSYTTLKIKYEDAEARIATLEKAIESALGWVQANDRDKPYNDTDLVGELVRIRLTGLCVLAEVIGKRDSQKILDGILMRHQTLSKKDTP